MLFDWFTVFAQILNFLILMWLLRRFLYKPVLNAIDDREKRIADLLKQTELNQIQTEQQQAELTSKNIAFSAHKEQLLFQAKEEAMSTKQHWLDNASNEVAKQRSQWLLGLQKEQHELDQDIRLRTQQAVFRVARKALQDLSCSELESQIVQVFIKQLLQLSKQQADQFSSSALGQLVIRSAFVLSEDNKKNLQIAVEEVFSARLTVVFEIEATLVSGIEIVGSGHKLSWNIDDYLSGFVDVISGLVDRKVQQDAQMSSLSIGVLNANSQ